MTYANLLQFETSTYSLSRNTEQLFGIRDVRLCSPAQVPCIAVGQN